MPDYIIEPLDTNADEIFQNFVEFVRTTFPDWEPSEGQLDVIIARYFSMQAAFTADMASRVQRAIFRYFGASLANIQPLPGAPAQATIHFVIDDPNEPPVNHTLPLGTLVALTDNDGDSFAFSTMTDLVVLAGATDAEVQAQAIDSGADENGITGTVEMIEQTDWIGTAHVVGASSGGADEEEDDLYIQRLTDNLRLMAPRPIFAEDFAVFAQNVPGVWRAAVIDNFGGGALDIQKLEHDCTGGTMQIDWMSETTTAILWNATSTQMRTALEGLAQIDSSDIDVTGGPLPGTPIVVTFKGKWAYQYVDLLEIDDAGLVGGTFVSTSKIGFGQPFDTNTENSIALSAVDVDGNPLPTAVKDQLLEYLASTRPQNFLITFVDPAYHVVNVNYTVRAVRYQDPDTIRALINTNLANYLDPSNWGRYPFQSQSRVWQLQPTVRYLELTTVVENILGVDYIEDLTFNIDGGAMTSANKTFEGGPFSLTRPGVIDGIVSLPV